MKQFLETVKDKSRQKKIYIYGAGLYAQRVYQLLSKNNINVEGFIVTNDNCCNSKLFPLPIHIARSFCFTDVLVVIGANRHNTLEIIDYLEKKVSCVMRDVVCACEYLDHRKIDENYYKIPTIELTTVIGCKVNCKYCPQKLLIGKYYENDLNREKEMSMETFRKCLNHLPKECNIQFCGMAEPFLNKNCSDMIIEAQKSGRNIELYTTLVGATRMDIEKIWNLPLDYVNIHIPDSEGNAQIPITEEYLQLLSDLVNHKNGDRYFVNLCNAQGAPDDRVKDICCDKMDVSTVLHDRAGNLDAPTLIKKVNRCGAISCSLCGNNLNHNVVLPDGTVLLCCMDYGMKHVIGNLVEQTYEEIISGKEVELIKRGMNGVENIDILCRKCSNASKL